MATAENHESTKAIFHQSETESTRTSRLSINLIHGFSSFPSWKDRFRTKRAVATLVLIAFLGISIAAAAIAVPLVVKNKGKSEALVADHPATSKAFYEMNATTVPTSSAMTTSVSITASTEPTTLSDAVAQLVSEGWFPVRYSGHIYLYKISSEKAAYTVAKTQCLRAGFTLATVGLRIPAVRTRLFATMVFPLGESIFIGLDDLTSKHTWKWVDGVLSTRQNTNWSKTEPNSARERCAEIARARNFLVNDIVCNGELHYLCEKVI